jgi:hypothetical protein
MLSQILMVFNRKIVGIENLDFGPWSLVPNSASLSKEIPNQVRDDSSGRPGMTGAVGSG